MNQIGVQLNLCKKSKSSGGWGEVAAPAHDVCRRDDSNRGAIKSLQTVQKVAGGVLGGPPMMFDEVMIQLGSDW